MRIQVSPSENYSREDVRSLLEELGEDGVEVVQAGIYGRRSLDALPPALILTATFVAGAFASGLLNAAGTDAWAALKRVISRAVATRHKDQHPTVMLVLNLNDREVRLQALSYVPNTVLAERLDKALERAQELERGGTLIYDEGLDTWLTLDEALFSRVQRVDASH